MLSVPQDFESEARALLDPAPDHTARVLLLGWRSAERAAIAAELAAGSAGGAERAVAEVRAGEALLALGVAQERYREYMDDLERSSG
jgi:type IV pilus biogenesis protein CpaD/CtpE